MSGAPAAVIDTNVLLDWLVFRDPRVDALSTALIQRRLRWLACPPMRDELARMLAHRSLAQWHPDAGAALARFDELACIVAEPPVAAVGGLSCSDADDQVFVDLALQHRADWLLSHDRALLKLASRARRRGLTITTPDRWAIAPTTEAPDTGNAGNAANAANAANAGNAAGPSGFSGS